MHNLVSIIIPTYNGEKYIAECIDSVFAQGVNVEIIVIDDISTDRTAAIAREMGANVFVNEVHKGQVAGKNTGIRLANGKYWLTIDQDDKLAPGALNRLIKEIEIDDSRVIVMAQLQDFCSPDTPDQQKFCKPKPFRGILTGSTLFRKSVFDTIGLWREDIITGDVIDLMDRVKQARLSVKNVDFVACQRRIHAENFGRTNQKDEYKNYATLLRAHLANTKKN